MKRMVLAVAVVALAYGSYFKTAERKREALEGKWSSERAVQGGALRLVMNLKPEGNMVLSLDGTLYDRPLYFRVDGKWSVQSNTFVTTMDRSDIPGFKPGKEFGGAIVKLDGTDFSYKTTDGVESWTKLP